MKYLIKPTQPVFESADDEFPRLRIHLLEVPHHTHWEVEPWLVEELWATDQVLLVPVHLPDEAEGVDRSVLAGAVVVLEQELGVAIVGQLQQVAERLGNTVIRYCEGCKWYEVSGK